uniref:Uncharacterized protein n=1 Tax=Cannabis sativa TaxID=3483 RepID=A0A803Q0D6_CANSA
MGRVGIVEDATHSLDGREPEVGQAKAPVANHDVEIWDSESEVEEVLPARRRLGQSSMIGVDHVLIKAAKPQVLDQGPQELGEERRSPLPALDSQRHRWGRHTTNQAGGQISSLPTCPCLHLEAREARTRYGFYMQRSSWKAFRRGFRLPPVRQPMIVDPPLRRTQPSSKGTHRPNRRVDLAIRLRALEADHRRMDSVLSTVDDELRELGDGKLKMLSSKIIYEIKLHNPKVDLSYIGASFLESTLAQGKQLYEKRMEKDQTTALLEGSSLGQFDKAMADTPTEVVDG